jgi:hypothetical protein
MSETMDATTLTLMTTGEMGAALAAPFRPEEVDWRPAGKGGANQRAHVVCYVDARAVQDRLDTVLGPLGWAFDWQPVATSEAGEVTAAKGTLTIGGVSKSDVGTASSYEPSKGAVSDALKRASVLWGIGRYLYALPVATVTLNAQGHIPVGTLADLRAALGRRGNAASLRAVS